MKSSRLAIVSVLLASVTVLACQVTIAEGPPPDRSVIPTGQSPTDAENVQAAVNLGGTVLLKATDTMGMPTAFNFGPAVAGSDAVYLNTDVNILGEIVGTAQTTIVGGNGPFRSYVSLRSEIRGIFFDGPRIAGAHVRASTGFTFSGNHVARVVPFPYFSEGMKAQGVWIEGYDVIGEIVIEDNLFEDAGWAEAGYGIAIFPDRAQATIAGNTIRGAGLAGIVASPWSGQMVIENNYVAPGPFNPNLPNYGNGIHVVGTFTGGTLTVRNNEVFCENYQADGIILIGLSAGHGPLENSVIERNRVTLVNSDYGAITLFDEVSNTLVRNNNISGRGTYGFNILHYSSDGLARSNIFRGNNLENFKATSASLFLDTNSRQTVVLDRFDTIIDLGKENEVNVATEQGADR